MAPRMSSRLHFSFNIESYCPLRNPWELKNALEQNIFLAIMLGKNGRKKNERKENAGPATNKFLARPAGRPAGAIFLFWRAEPIECFKPFVLARPRSFVLPQCEFWAGQSWLRLPLPTHVLIIIQGGYCCYFVCRCLYTISASEFSGNGVLSRESAMLVGSVVLENLCTGKKCESLQNC